MARAIKIAQNIVWNEIKSGHWSVWFVTLMKCMWCVRCDELLPLNVCLNTFCFIKKKTQFIINSITVWGALKPYARELTPMNWKKIKTKDGKRKASQLLFSKKTSQFFFNYFNKILYCKEHTNSWDIQFDGNYFLLDLPYWIPVEDVVLKNIDFSFLKLN